MHLQSVQTTRLWTLGVFSKATRSVPSIIWGPAGNAGQVLLILHSVVPCEASRNFGVTTGAKYECKMLKPAAHVGQLTLSVPAVGPCVQTSCHQGAS